MATVTIKINLKDGSLQALGEALAVNNSIKKLSIKNIFVDKAEAATFAHCVAQNKSIKELDLFNNIDVSGNFMRIILENNQNIETLNIRATPVCLGELAKTIEEANFCVTGVEFTDVGKYANGANDLKKSIQRNFDIKTRNEVAGVLDRDDIFPDALKGLILDYVSIKPSTSPHPATASSARQSSDKSH